MPPPVIDNRPSLQSRLAWFTLTLAAVALFAALGLWQWNRGTAREAAWLAIDQTAPIRLTGTWQADRQFLLENMTRQGRPGYEVLTPFLAQDRLWLVNRGWIPFDGFRESLPDVSLATPSGAEQTVIGMPAGLPVSGLDFGRRPPATEGGWPRATSFPTLDELELSLGKTVESQVLQLSAETGPGYRRDWPRPGVPPDRHFAYAFQWWGFATLALVLYVFLNLRKKR
jgi:surfeit locus 1 family protein